MYGDPKGYYARLEVDPKATRDAIAAAYRRKARLLHPDVPRTGNLAAFVAMKEAYEILGNPLRRAAYDRSAQDAPAQPAPPPRRRQQADEAEELFAAPPPQLRVPPIRHPRLSDIPFWAWAVLIGVGILAGGEAVLQLRAGPPRQASAAITANAPYVAPEAPPVPNQPVQLAGAPNAYILPSGGDAVVWHYDQATDRFQPIGHVAPFTAIQVVRVVTRHGMVEVLLGQHATGFIDASQVTPGNTETAHEAFCAYNAGPEPSNAEVLSRHGRGPLSVTLVNRSAEPTVVKLRSPQGVTAVSVYLAPNGSAQVGGLPAGAYQPEYAVGELWSRACHSFAAGMQSERFSASVDLSRISALNLPPDLLPGVHVVDIPNQEFALP